MRERVPNRANIPYTAYERQVFHEQLDEFLDKTMGIVIIGASYEVAPIVLTTLSDSMLKRTTAYVYANTGNEFSQELLTDNDGNKLKKGD